jgi:hypothetical protein
MEIPFDTDRAAYEIQRKIYMRLGARERMAMAFRLSDTVRRLAISGIRHRHPDYTDAEVKDAFARLRLGDSVVRAIWPDRALVDP